MNILHHRFALSLSILLIAACGSSNKSTPGGGDVVAQCKQGCAKYVSLCAADLGGQAAAAQAFCESACTSTGPQQGQTCSNSSEVLAAYQSCQSATTCDAYMTCVENVPPCTGSSGTGGSSGAGTGGRAGGGTGGSSGGGTGGAGGGSAGTACADLLACCNRATNPTFMAVCNSSYTMVRDMGNDACAQALTAIQSTVCP